VQGLVLNAGTNFEDVPGAFVAEDGGVVNHGGELAMP
jgi:hypothetical protein